MDYRYESKEMFAHDSSDEILWKPIYKWSGTNSTWLEYLENATNEIKRHMRQNKKTKEKEIVRERGYNILKTILVRRYESPVQIDASSVLARLYDSISKGTRDGIHPPPPEMEPESRPSMISLDSTSTDIALLDEEDYGCIKDYNLRRVGNWLQTFFEQSTEGIAYKITTKFNGHNRNGFETLKRLAESFGAPKSQDCVIKFNWGSGSFNAEWFEYQRIVSISRICEIDSKHEKLCIAIARRGIKRYRFSSDFSRALINNFGTTNPECTWTEFQNFVNEFIQKFMCDSFKRIQEKFLPDLSLMNENYNSGDEHLKHEEACQILRKFTDVSIEKTQKRDNWDSKGTTNGFLPGLIPEDKANCNPQPKGNLKTQKAQNKKNTLNIGNKWNNGNKNNRGRPNTQIKDDKVAKRCVVDPKKSKSRSPGKNNAIESPTSNNAGKKNE